MSKHKNRKNIVMKTVAAGILVISLLFVGGCGAAKDIGEHKETGGVDAANAQAKLLISENGAINESPVSSLEELIEQSEKPIFIDFWAEWCGPCKVAEPFVETLADEYSGKAHIVKVNVDEQQALASAFRIQSIPTFIVIDEGEITSSVMGYTDRMQDDLRSMIDERLR